MTALSWPQVSKFAQEKWSDFRQAHCSFYDSGQINQAVRLEANECTLNYTAQRATELEKLKAN